MCLAKNEFGAKFGIILGVSWGISKIKRVSYDKVSDMISMIKKHPESKVHKQVDNFTLPDKLKTLIDIST